MTIRSIHGRIQGRDVSVDMEAHQRHILLVGDNGAGKDTVSRVIALALSGGVDDTLNRGTASPSGEPVRAPVDMAYLIAERSGDAPDGIFCEVSYEPSPGADLSVATYSLLPAGKGERTRKWTLPPDCALDGKATKNTWWTLPVREVYAMLAAGPDTARKWFLPYIAGNGGNVKAAVLDAFRVAGVDQAALDAAGVVIPETPEALIDMLEAQITAATETATSHAALETRAAQRKQGITTVRPTQDQLVAANAAQASLQSVARQLRESFGAAGGSRPLLGLIRDKQATLQTQVVTLTAEQGVLNQMHAALPARPDPAETYPPFVPSSPWGQVAAAWRTLRQSVTASLGQYQQVCGGLPNITPPSLCPVCGVLPGEHSTLSPQGPFRSPAQRAEALAKQDTGAQALLDQLSAEQTVWATGQAAWMSARVVAGAAHQTFDERVTRFNGWVAAHNALKQEITQLVASAASATATPANTPTLADVEAAELAASEAIGAAERLQSAHAQWEALSSDDGLLAMSKDLLEKRQAMVTTLKSVVEGVLTAAVDAFQAKVQRHLPADMKLKILLRDPGPEGRRVFRFGLVDSDGILAVALSGGQRLAVMLALTEAILEQVPYATGAATFFTPAEVSWHTHTLAQVMAAVAPIRHTIVLCAAEPPPAGSIPPEWRVVHVSEAVIKCPAAASPMLVRARGGGGGEEKKKSTRKGNAKAREAPVGAAPGSVYAQPSEPAAAEPGPGPSVSEQAPAPEPTPEPAPTPTPEPAPAGAKPSNVEVPFPTADERAALVKLGWAQGKIRRLAQDVIARVLRDRLNGNDYIVGVDGQLTKLS